MHVITADVGGSFGMKGFDFPEHALVPWAAALVGRPVNWTCERQEAFLSATPRAASSRSMPSSRSMREARFLAIRAETFANIGAYLSYFSLLIPTVAGFRLLTGAYRIPAAYVHVRAVYTNTVWVDAYRGAGRPETRLYPRAPGRYGGARDRAFAATRSAAAISCRLRRCPTRRR